MLNDFSIGLVGKQGKGENEPHSRTDWLNTDPETIPWENGFEPKRFRFKYKGGDCWTNTLNFSVFFRFLNANIGKPWDEVYSEIRHRFNFKKPIPLHCHQIDNAISYILDGGWKGFYVDEERILRKEEQKKVVYSNVSLLDKKRRIYKRVGNRHFAKIKNKKGITHWYELTMKEMPSLSDWRKCRWSVCSDTEKYELENLRDLFLENINPPYDENARWNCFNNSFSYHWAIKLYGSPIYCVGKRQINSREIKKFKLNE